MIKKRLATIACVIVAVTGSAVSAADLPPDIGIRLVLGRSEYAIGEPIDGRLTITNSSNGPLLIPDTAFMRMKWKRLDSTVQEMREKVDDEAIHQAYLIKPGEVLFERVHLMGQLGIANNYGPGEYSISYSLESKGKIRVALDPETGTKVGNAEGVEIKCWSGHAASNEIKITFKELTRETDKSALGILIGGGKTYWDIWFSGRVLKWKSVVQKEPQSIFAEHCAYAIAKSTEGFREGIAEYQSFLQKFPTSQHSDAAKLGLARQYLYWERRKWPGLDNRVKAIELLKEIVSKNPEGEVAPEAEYLLSAIATPSATYSAGPIQPTSVATTSRPGTNPPEPVWMEPSGWLILRPLREERSK